MCFGYQSNILDILVLLDGSTCSVFCEYFSLLCFEEKKLIPATFTMTSWCQKWPCNISLMMSAKREMKFMLRQVSKHMCCSSWLQNAATSAFSNTLPSHKTRVWLNFPIVLSPSILKWCSQTVKVFSNLASVDLES